MADSVYDVIIIGSGPGGYVCAIRCAQLGLKTALVEKDVHLGGTCLNVGCIPSKALLHSTELYQEARHGEAHGLLFDNLRPDVARLMERKGKVVDQLRKGVAMLVQKRGIEVHRGSGRLKGTGTVVVTDADGGEKSLQGKHIVLATGSVPVALPFLKPDGERVLTSTEALELKEIPTSLIVVGAGAIGLELGSVWSRLGSTVTFVEFLPTIAAGSDDDVSKLAERIFKKQGMKFLTSTKVVSAEVGSDSVTLKVERNGKVDTLTAERVLLSVGRKPFTVGLDLESAGVASDDKGRIRVSSFQTTAKDIWAIGDVIEGPMLAHKAEEDGVAVANRIAGLHAEAHYGRVPGVIYTHPEIASIGMTERQAKEAGIPVKVGTFNLLANGRAIAQDATDGMAKVIAHAESDAILGAAIIAAGASEMIAAVAAHMEYGGSAEDLAATIHAHPTISEALKEAALAVDGKAIHAI